MTQSSMTRCFFNGGASGATRSLEAGDGLETGVARRAPATPKLPVRRKRVPQALQSITFDGGPRRHCGDSAVAGTCQQGWGRAGLRALRLRAAAAVARGRRVRGACGCARARGRRQPGRGWRGAGAGAVGLGAEVGRLCAAPLVPQWSQGPPGLAADAGRLVLPLCSGESGSSTLSAGERAARACCGVSSPASVSASSSVAAVKAPSDAPSHDVSTRTRQYHCRGAVSPAISSLSSSGSQHRSTPAGTAATPGAMARPGTPRRARSAARKGTRVVQRPSFSGGTRLKDAPRSALRCHAPLSTPRDTWRRPPAPRG